MKKKNILGIGAVFFVVAIMVSSATVVPLSSKEAVDNTIQEQIKQNKKDKQSSMFLSILQKINPNALLMLLSVMNNLGFNKAVYQTLNDMTIIGECKNYYNDGNVKAKITEAKTELQDTINSFSEQDRQLLKEFFDIDNTFSLSAIWDRICSLHEGTVLYDVQDLLKVWDNYDDFNSSRQVIAGKFLNLISNHNFSSNDMYYPVVDKICALLNMISMIWAVPLLLLGGLVGLTIASFITMIFFAPIIIPMTFYIGAIECLAHDTELLETLVWTFVSYGLVGLLAMGMPLLLIAMFQDDYVTTGFQYILDRLLILSVDKQQRGRVLVTGETAPEYRRPFDIIVYSGKTATIKMAVCDYDFVLRKDLDLNQRRDYAQIGFDWNRDKVVDEWSEFVYSVIDEQIIVGKHYFGEFSLLRTSFFVVVRDNWGCRSDWIQITVHGFKSKNVDKSVASFPFSQNILQSSYTQNLLETQPMFNLK